MTPIGYQANTSLPAENPKAPERKDLLASFTSCLKYTIQPPKAVHKPANNERPIASQL